MVGLNRLVIVVLHKLHPTPAARQHTKEFQVLLTKAADIRAVVSAKRRMWRHIHRMDRTTVTYHPSRSLSGAQASRQPTKIPQTIKHQYKAIKAVLTRAYLVSHIKVLIRKTSLWKLVAVGGRPVKANHLPRWNLKQNQKKNKKGKFRVSRVTTMDPILRNNPKQFLPRLLRWICWIWATNPAQHLTLYNLRVQTY